MQRRTAWISARWLCLGGTPASLAGLSSFAIPIRACVSRASASRMWWLDTLLLAHLFLQLLPEPLDVFLRDGFARDVKDAVLGQDGLVAAGEAGEDADRFVAVAVGILHDRAFDGAVENSL